MCIQHHNAYSYSIEKIQVLSVIFWVYLLQLTRQTWGIFLFQKKYVEEIIEHARMSTCKTSPTPVDIHKGKTLWFFRQLILWSNKYNSLAEALQYLTFIIPDISYVVQQMCLFINDPKTQQMFHYIHGTIEFDLHMYPSSLDKLISYKEAYWVRCSYTRRPTLGYCVLPPVLFIRNNLLFRYIK